MHNIVIMSSRSHCFEDPEIGFDMSSIEQEINLTRMSQALAPSVSISDSYSNVISGINPFRRIRAAEFIQTARLVRGVCDLLFEESTVALKAECPQSLTVPYEYPKDHLFDKIPPYPPYVDISKVSDRVFEDLYNEAGLLSLIFKPLEKTAFPHAFVSLQPYSKRRRIEVYAQGRSAEGVSVGRVVDTLSPKFAKQV